MSKLSSFEQQIFDMLLAGDNEELSILREQLEEASVIKREMTGAGFYTTLAVPETVKTLPNKSSIKFGDVAAEISGLNHGAGFLLYIEDGKLSMLEGYSYDEKWPDKIKDFKISYVPNNSRNIEFIKKHFMLSSPSTAS